MSEHPSNQPESEMMGYGYTPSWSEGAVKVPIFQTSTFVFRTAEEGKAFFRHAYGIEKNPSHANGLIYSRLNNPDLQILEERLALWDETEASAVFSSGMAAIATAILDSVRPGDVVLHSTPIYGGAHHLFHKVLVEWGITPIPYLSDETPDQIRTRLASLGLLARVSAIYIETPANPTNTLFDLAEAVELAKSLSTESKQVTTICDNTFLGPMWQKPLRFGIDIVLYSATKYLGGHSDLIAGACSGSSERIGRLKSLRTFYGNMLAPQSAWLLMRSLETLQVRTDRQAATAIHLAQFLSKHPKVSAVYSLSQLEAGSRQAQIFKNQCSSAGAMIAFEVAGGEAEAFQFLNALKLIKLAVSLGSTESLAQHPASMTHVDVPEDERQRIGITDNLVRLSVGVENPHDLIVDLTHAFDAVTEKYRKAI